ncbi:MAG: vitamin K epoxide reductase family protein [Deltaproteobacteria bacterium]|nr:vitamin K epoxide reductase family protein [Deltaproteobacteria bacterium]
MASPSLWFYLLSLLGLAVSGYVWRSQRSNRPVACWTRDCDRVIRSPYSRLLGVHNSAIGFWLFLFIFVMTSLRHLGLEPWPKLTSFTVAFLSFIGTLVSLYLTYVQFLILKGICNWCLTSAAAILAIFILTVTGG